MKRMVCIIALCMATAPAWAEKKCDELKTEIAAKLDAKGVKNYQLEVIATEAVKDDKVVGSCEAGKKKITYKRGA